MLTTALAIYGSLVVLTIVWPFVLMALGFSRPGAFTLLAPAMIPIMIIAVPLMIVFDGHRLRNSLPEVRDL